MAGVLEAIAKALVVLVQLANLFVMVPKMKEALRRRPSRFK